VVSGSHHLQGPADVGAGLALGDQLLGSLEPADDLLRCVQARFMVESPVQSGRMRTLIDPGEISGGHVRIPEHTHDVLLKPQHATRSYQQPPRNPLKNIFLANR